MGKLYEATSLEDIAEHFERRAAMAWAAAMKAKTEIVRREHMAERRGWVHAADILRDTKLP